MPELNGIKIGYAMCGSFCTFSRSIEQLRRLVDMGADVTAIMSFNAASIDTRFGTAESFRKSIEEITGKAVIRTIEDAEPIGPRKMFDVLVICPCTGNTLAKLANSITDTTVVAKRKQYVLWNCRIAESIPIKWINFSFWIKTALILIYMILESE